MKKIFTLAVLFAAVAMVSCGCFTKKANNAEEQVATECCAECCAEQQECTEACCAECPEKKECSECTEKKECCTECCAEQQECAEACCADCEK